MHNRYRSATVCTKNLWNVVFIHRSSSLTGPFAQAAHERYQGHVKRSFGQLPAGYRRRPPLGRSVWPRLADSLQNPRSPGFHTRVETSGIGGWRPGHCSPGEADLGLHQGLAALRL